MSNVELSQPAQARATHPVRDAVLQYERAAQALIAEPANPAALSAADAAFTLLRSLWRGFLPAHIACVDRTGLALHDLLAAAGDAPEQARQARQHLFAMTDVQQHASRLG